MADERIDRAACGRPRPGACGAAPAPHPDPLLSALLGTGAWLYGSVPWHRCPAAQLRGVARRMRFLCDPPRRTGRPHYHLTPGRFRRAG